MLDPISPGPGGQTQSGRDFLHVVLRTFAGRDDKGANLYAHVHNTHLDPLSPVYRAHMNLRDQSRGDGEIARLTSEMKLTVPFFFCFFFFISQHTLTLLFYSLPHPHRATIDFPLRLSLSLNNSSNYCALPPALWQKTPQRVLRSVHTHMAV